MPYDKYRNWPLPSLSGNIFPVIQGTNIEEQVLKDLAETEDKIDKLEILDSYAAYAKRAYQEECARYFTVRIAQVLGNILEPTILSKLPSIGLVHRGRPAEPEKK